MKMKLNQFLIRLLYLKTIQVLIRKLILLIRLRQLVAVLLKDLIKIRLEITEKTADTMLFIQFLMKIPENLMRTSLLLEALQV